MSILRAASASLVTLVLATSCTTSAGQHINDHWSAKSIVPRVGRYFTGYDAQEDGTYGDYTRESLASMRLTLRRHFMNQNPRNPFQVSSTPTFEAPEQPNEDQEFRVSRGYDVRYGLAEGSEDTAEYGE